VVQLAQVQGRALPMFGQASAVAAAGRLGRHKVLGVEVVWSRFDKSTLVQAAAA